MGYFSFESRYLQRKEGSGRMAARGDPRVSRRVLVFLFAVLLVGPAAGAGFGIFEQGAKAIGLAGAFTARADDPSASFHNAGGLAFFRDRSFQVGATFISAAGTDFIGAAPFPGPKVTESAEPLFKVPPHFYWVEPVGERWTFGLAVNSPFGLTSKWKSPTFSGRFVSVIGSLVSYDLNPNLAWKVSETLGIGFGPVLRFSEFELSRNQGFTNPLDAALIDVARIDIRTNLESGVGFQLGVLGRPRDGFSWGLAYKSEIETEFAGDSSLRQNLTGFESIDDLVRTLLPLGQSVPMTTELEYPAMASLGLAVAMRPNWLVELDINWTGWSSLDELVLDFSGVLPASRDPLNWNDVYSYRLGVSRSTRREREWRFGFYFDETPQPLEDLGPLLADGDRRGVSLGYGFETRSVGVDLALVYVPIEERLTQVNLDGFNGSYASTATLFAVTVDW